MGKGQRGARPSTTAGTGRWPSRDLPLPSNNRGLNWGSGPGRWFWVGSGLKVSLAPLLLGS